MSVTGKVDTDFTRDDVGNFVSGRAVTATLRVSPNGDGSNGLSWPTAYTTIEDALDALDAASTDKGDCTLILISPHETNYNINTADDPTWAANVILMGTHRNWTSIKNTHASATSIMKLTGKSAAIDLNFHLGSGSVNGLIMTRGGCRGYNLQFIGKDLTGAATALWIDADSKRHAKLVDCNFLGHVTHMTALKVDQMAYSLFDNIRIHDCLVGIHIVGAASDKNIFSDIDLGDSALGLDIDAGSEQHFREITLHHNTTNVDDEVGDHEWTNIFGSFPIIVLPDNLTGTTVNTNVAADTWGVDTELLAAVGRDKPFRIVGIHTEPSAAGWFSVRFSADGGATHYDVLLFDGTKREGIAAPSGTEFIFNKGTRISASAKSDTGGDSVQIWLEIQEI